MCGLQLSSCIVGVPVSLEGYCSTIELYPQIKGLALPERTPFTGGLRAAQSRPLILPSPLPRENEEKT